MPYISEATKYTPKIHLDDDKELLHIEGDSFPENALDTYQPLIEAMENYFCSPDRSLKVDMVLTYTNTSSSKMIGDIIRKLQHWHDKGHSLDLTWYYYSGDIDSKEDGEIYLEDVKFPYKILELQE